MSDDELNTIEQELRKAMHLDGTWEHFLEERCNPEALLALIAQARQSSKTAAPNE